MENATFAILTGIQASLAYLRAETVTRFGRLDARVVRRDLGMRAGRRNATGMRVMRRATAGDVDARFSAAEDRVAAPENRTLRGSSAERMPCAAPEIDRKRGTRQSGTTQLS
ncbi:MULTISPECIES: hypothetical protein [Methylobacterium]|uniref:hypothetical protein n=1 Tax=Methylobacterium TaxID=407 RepID=UPI002F3611CC